MENFSKFFDDAIKNGNLNENKPVQSMYMNKDNTIYYNIDNIDSDPEKIHTFPAEDYYLLANELILGASKLYNKSYDSRSVPFAFIAFFIGEFSLHFEIKSAYLKKFLILFNNKQNNVANAINVFIRAYKKDADIKIVQKNSLFNSLKAGHYLFISNELCNKTIAYSNKIDANLKTAIDETRRIITSIDETAKETALKAKYLNFLSEESSNSDTLPSANEIKIYDENNNPKTKPKKKKLIVPPKQEKEDKVSNISLPRLKIGRMFPTSFTHSRIDSAHFAFKFMEVDRAYQLVKRYKFSRANYTDGFETKRKSLFETKKSSFDFF